MPYFRHFPTFSYSNKAEEYSNCRNIPLPYERTTGNEQFICEAYWSAPEYIVPIFPDWVHRKEFDIFPSPHYAHLLFSFGEQPSYKFHVSTHYETRTEHKERFIRFFSELKVPRELWGEERWEISTPHYLTIWDELEYMAHYYAYSLIKRCNEEVYGPVLKSFHRNLRIY